LDATVRQPAEAEKYKVEKLAEANRYIKDLKKCMKQSRLLNDSLEFSI